MTVLSSRPGAIAGCLVGAAVGDGLGLAFEGLSPSRSRRLFGDFTSYRFFGHWGMGSDDTEHLCMVAQALLASNGDPDRFAHSLGWRLRFWLLGLPAGVGWATLRACVRLWLGWSPRNSGVYSAGNGPAMRSALIGVLYLDEPETLKGLVCVSTRITHTDPLAETGALLVAVAAGCAARQQVFWDALPVFLPDGGGRFAEALARLKNSLKAGEATQSFAAALGLQKGVSGYVLHTVPVALHAWLSNEGDYRSAITAVIECGGDTDTTAAITGAICGAQVGVGSIPIEWKRDFCDYPRSLQWISKLGDRLGGMRTDEPSQGPLPLAVWALPLRNLFFLCVVLLHGLRRIFPPW